MKSGKQKIKIIYLSLNSLKPYSFSNDHFIILDKAGNLFKDKLYKKIEKRFTIMWEELDMNSNLAFLEVSKTESEKLGSSEWRPASVSADDQVRPHIIKQLLNKKKILQAQIAEQESQIAVSSIIFNKASLIIVLFLGIGLQNRRCQTNIPKSKRKTSTSAGTSTMRPEENSRGALQKRRAGRFGKQKLLMMIKRTLINKQNSLY
jgi:hypothetical protein